MFSALRGSAAGGSVSYTHLDVYKRQRQYISGLTGQFITHLVLQILSYVAQIERENILIRQSEGIACAKRKGVKFGRPKKPMPENFEEIYRDWRNCRISMREASRRLSTNPVSYTHLWRKEKPFYKQRMKRSMRKL